LGQVGGLLLGPHGESRHARLLLHVWIPDAARPYTTEYGPASHVSATSRRSVDAESRGQRDDLPRRARNADGQPDARVLGARAALLRAARAGLRPGAGDAARRAADRLPQLLRRRRPAAERVPPPRG